MKHNYRIASNIDFSGGRSYKVIREGKQREPSRAVRAEFKRLDKPKVDPDLERMEFMTSREAAKAAARAIAEAEVAMAEAEEAVRLAETVETYAEEAVALAEAVSSALKNRNAAMMVIFLILGCLNFLIPM